MKTASDRPLRASWPALRASGIGLLLAATTVFWALHFVHLRADFPNHSPWGDWAKYTDEGWYGDAAIRHLQRGSWYVAGDFNPAIALPVLPLLEVAVFRFTGVSVVAARALSVTLFGAVLAAGFVLLWRADATGRRRHTVAAATGVLLLAVSPFCYAFSRLAILEPPLILLTLLALLAAHAAPRTGAQAGGLGGSSPVAGLRVVVALGILLPAMVLAKTTAVFLMPAIFFVVWARGGFRLAPLLRTGGGGALLGGALWSAYYLVLVRPRYLLDYRYLFSANAYTRLTPGTAFTVVREMVRDTLWIGGMARVFGFVLLITILIAAATTRGRLKAQAERYAVAIALVLWILGYAVFLTYHNNLQARYYVVLAVPMCLFVPLALDLLWRASQRRVARVGVALVTAAVVAVGVVDARATLAYVRTPEYTLVDAAAHLAAIMRADPTRSPLMLSISGSELSLITGLPSICDDFGTEELPDRVARYHPGWFLSWNQIDDDKMDALMPLYRVQRVAAFPAMDDPERNLLILYRLDPPTGEHGPRRRRGAPPHRLLTRLGQQPSTVQLEH